jgi:hypothetical protein
VSNAPWLAARPARLSLAVGIALFLLPGPAPLFAEEPEPPAGEEGQAKKKDRRLVPIPIFVTEPAIGYGLGAAVAYFHKREEDGEGGDPSLGPGLTTGTTNDRRKGQKRPPDTTGVAAAYTDKGTWLVGGGHFASWRQDRIRYTGVLAYANIESTFYFGDDPWDFNLRGGILYQDVKFRLRDSRFFVGGKLSYLGAEGKFDLGESVPADFGSSRLADFGVALQGVYEGRDNTMTPNRGQLVELIGWKYLEALGGEFDYWKGKFRVLSFHPFAERFVLGLRLELDAVSGRPPLWGPPYIKLRGIPALRYQNERVAVAATELRWNILERWAVLAFVGVGATAGDNPLYNDESGIVAGGVGGRYLFRPEDDIWVGVDLARGPERGVLYLQVGHAW